MSCFPLYPLFVIMSLLSLNETTLYYYFLSDRTSNSKEKFSTGINHWAATILDNAKLDNNKVASTSASRSKLSSRSGSHVPPLTNATSHSSNASVLSKSIKISQKLDVKVTSTQADKFINLLNLGLRTMTRPWALSKRWLSRAHLKVKSVFQAL